MPDDVTIREITRDQVGLMRPWLDMFGEAFEEVDTYSNKQPGTAYLEKLLSSDCFIALAALKSAA